MGDGWPVEHVLPQMFGRYEPANLVLNDVCAGCNNAFSKLEQALGRDSPEALQRLVHGLKPLAAAGQLENRRVTYFVDRPGPWYGARVILNGDHELYPVFLPQAAFQLSEDAPWTWILEEQISADAIQSYLGKRYRVKLVGDSEVEMDRVRDKLERLGVSFRDVSPLELPDDDGKIVLGLQVIVDDVVLRAIVKIAFNYLAYIGGPGLALGHDFDELRQYILVGAPIPRWPPVALSRHQFLLPDHSQSAQAVSHELELGWNSDGSSPVVQVSFFGGNTYRVTLTANYHGIWIPLSAGHRFDHQARRIDAC